MDTRPQTLCPAIIGRQPELEELTHAFESGRPELVAVYGRRRVGKTFLVRSFFASALCFELTGERKASQRQQLRNFAKALQKATGFKHSVPRDWSEALDELARYLEGPLREGRKAVFFDELPWLAGRRSRFLPAFEHFWNTWGTRQDNLIVVVCGSAASWMIRKVLHDKGGLHNRTTLKLPLQPFNLHETEAFLHARGVALERMQLLELAMATGGVPYYLDYVRKGRSAAQNIDSLFFTARAPLRSEFDQLFASLFEHHERHVAVIRALARKQSGMSRQELTRYAKLPSGGTMTRVLEELEHSGFICRIVPFGRTMRDVLYRAQDEFTLFHLRWIETNRERPGSEGQWLRVRSTPAWQAWSGYAFENLCLTHVGQIKKALGISGVFTEISSWRYSPREKDESGAQIDLLIDRKDDVINVCEMKFADEEFTIDKKYAAQLREKLQVFRRVTETRKAPFLTFVTAHGIKRNDYAVELVQNSVTAEALFEA